MDVESRLLLGAFCGLFIGQVSLVFICFHFSLGFAVMFFFSI
jgi:hypothetical protein